MSKKQNEQVSWKRWDEEVGGSQNYNTSLITRSQKIQNSETQTHDDATILKASNWSRSSFSRFELVRGSKFKISDLQHSEDVKPSEVF